MSFYHDGMRELQDRYEGRAVPDRLAETRMRRAFSDTDRAFIETSSFFFLSTATAENVDCSFKGGDPGFVRTIDENLLEWADYDGNRMYRSLGNILRSPKVGLLFIRFDGTRFDGAARLRINGRAEIDETSAARENIPGAKRIIRVSADYIYTNCPRYIPKMSSEEPSVYTPRAGQTPPEPAWKSRPFVKDLFDAERERDRKE
jgi:predicted pyridoxine 5'-phosphate oxidase superfamily flavin-nucleotide-binding protein